MLKIITQKNIPCVSLQCLKTYCLKNADELIIGPIELCTASIGLTMICTVYISACSPEEFTCTSDFTCIPAAYDCDGIPNCYLAEDELCKGTNFQILQDIYDSCIESPVIIIAQSSQWSLSSSYSSVTADSCPIVFFGQIRWFFFISENITEVEEEVKTEDIRDKLLPDQDSLKGEVGKKSLQVIPLKFLHSDVFESRGLLQYLLLLLFYIAMPLRMYTRLHYTLHYICMFNFYFRGCLKLNRYIFKSSTPRGKLYL